MGFYIREILRLSREMTAEEAEQYLIERAEESKLLRFCFTLIYALLFMMVGVFSAIYLMNKYGG